MTAFDPVPELAAHVAGYWGLVVGVQTAHGHAHQFAPDGCIAIVGHRTALGELRAALIGPRAEPLTIIVQPGDRFWGVRFWPDAGGVVLQEEPRRLHGHYVAPLAEPTWAVMLARALAACDDEAAAATVADALLAAPVAAAPPLDPLVRRAVEALIMTNGDLEIGALAEGVGLGLRQLERRFGAATGLTPQQYARVRKMRPVLPHLLGAAPRTWEEVLALPDERVRP